MKEKLTHNLGLKILAVILALFTWLIMVNVSNPLETGTQEVPVEIINKEILEKSGLTYEVVGKSTVTVSYSVRVRDKSRISAGDFYAYADLAELYDVTGAIPVKVEVKNRETASLIEEGPTVRPGVVRITTEELQTKRFTLKASASGEPEEGCLVGEIDLYPESVYVTGATSVVGQISSVGVVIPVEGANADLEGTASVCYYDANGNLLTDLEDEVEVNISEIDYKVSILKVKNVPLNFQVRGTVADGYRFTGVESDVTSIPVAGLKSALATFSSLEISGDELDVSGASKDVEVQIDLAKFLPENLTLVAPSVVRVVLKVEPLQTRSIIYDTKNVILKEQKEQWEYLFGEDEMELRIRGLKEDLDVLKPEDIQVELDVSEYEEGQHIAVFSIQLPEGFELMGRSAVTVDVSAAEGAEAPSENVSESTAAEEEGEDGEDTDPL